jgi:hypothetical protein
MKIPDPIMAPTTSMIESNKVKPRANSRGLESGGSGLPRSSFPVNG